MKKILLLTLALLMMCSLCVAVSANDNYVYSATDMFGFTSSGGGITGGDIVSEEGTLAIGFTSNGTVSNGADGTQLQINFKDIEGADFLLKEYPIVKMSYRSTIAATDAYIDINLGMNYKGTATRLWGGKTTYDHSGKYTTYIFDASKIFTGGENISDYSWSNVDANSGVNYLRLKPYYQGKPMAKDEVFNIEYIGFFKTEADAKNYKFVKSTKTSLTGLDLNFEAMRKNVGESFTLTALPYPSFAEISGATFTSENPEIATVDKNGKVTAVSAGDTYIVAKADGFEAKCHLYVFAEPIPAVKFVPRSILTEANVVVNALGDSITTYAPSPMGGMNYHDWWAQDYYVQNNDYGISGASLTANGQNPFVDRYINMVDNADLIVVKGGTNDFGSTAVGNINDRVKTTYYGAVKYLMEGLIEKYPDKQIVFLSVIRRCEGGQTPDRKNGHGNTLFDYTDVVMELGKVYNIPTVDLYNVPELDFTSKLITKSYTDENGKWHDSKCEDDRMPDGLHPSGKGHEIIAEYVLNALVEQGVIEIGDESDVESMEDIEVTDYKIFKAPELVKATIESKVDILNETVKEDGTEYASITAGAFKESLDSTYGAFNLKQLGADFLIKEYPYVKIGYKTNIEQRINSDILLKRNGKYSRHWGIVPAYVKDGKPHDIIINLNTSIGGAQDPGFTTLDDVDDDSSINEFWFKPWGGHTLAAMTSDHYFNVEYVAFFKSYVEASAFEYGVTADPIVKGSGFTDTLNHWGCDAIDYAVSRGLFNGVTETTFSPNGTMTRGMLVTVLSRLCKDTENKTAYPFTDVAANAWFANGVSFAYANKIVDAGNKFRPDDNVTREELADMLYRYAKNTGKNVELAEIAFADAGSITAKDAVAYCVKAGIIKGYDDNTFKPANSATRAEVATMIMRFVKAK